MIQTFNQIEPSFSNSNLFIKKLKSLSSNLTLHISSVPICELFIEHKLNSSWLIVSLYLSSTGNYNLKII